MPTRKNMQDLISDRRKQYKKSVKPKKSSKKKK